MLERKIWMLYVFFSNFVCIVREILIYHFMKKIKLFIAALVLVSAVVAISINARTSNDPFLEANLEALADNENGYGWLWEKYWTDCEVTLQIHVHTDAGNISAGVYVYSEAFLTQLRSLNASFTIVGGGPGKKSYCYDGWSTCKKNECR